MPSRGIPASAPLPPHHGQFSTTILPPLGAATAAAFSFLLFFVLCFRKISRKRTVPSESDLAKPPHRFSYSAIRRATNSFSTSLRLGQGGFGSVYRAALHLPNSKECRDVAIKVMDSGSLQGEREFQNELFLAAKLCSPYVVAALGFSSNRKYRTMLLVYDLMPNGNLQDALLHRKCPELRDWCKRFSIALDIARGIEYIHGLDPPVIHGDVKPSNVLLDESFSAKIADFGLAWVKEDNLNKQQSVCEIKVGVTEKKVELMETNSNFGSIVETESLTTNGLDEFSFGVDQSPESFLRSPEMAAEPVRASPDGNSVGGKELVDGGKQQNDGDTAESAVVKDYVIDWIGTEVKKERPKSHWIGSSSSSDNKGTGKMAKQKTRKRWDWWVSLDEDKEEKVLKKEKRRPPREWWKEEYCEELEKKRKKKKKKNTEGMGLNGDDNNNAGEEWWPRDDELYVKRKKNKRAKSGSSKGSIDWFSGELFRALGNSHDSMSGEIPKSGGVSSTPSMRGTVCYVAPECGGAGVLSEKSDVYSFGVLLLVLFAGRRPLEVTNSPMSEFQRANLIHWARQLARAGRLLDLVDQSVQSLDREQAVLCITVALLCLQKSPERRPSMKEVVGILTGETEAPALPIESSPSPPGRFPYKSRSQKGLV